MHEIERRSFHTVASADTQRAIGGTCIDVEAATSEQVKPGYLPPEFVTNAEADWKQRTPDQPVWIVCGDERFMNAESAVALTQNEPDVLSPVEAGLGVFGQVPGLAKNIMAVGIATHGPSFFDLVGGLDGLTDRLARSMEADHGAYAVRAATHTDTAKEEQAFQAAGKPKQNEAAFCTHGSGPVGCAYCENLGKASYLIGNNSDILELGRENVIDFCGDDAGVDALGDAHRAIAAHIGEDYRFDRQSFAKSGMPVLVLEGTTHELAAKTGLIFNFDPEQVGKMGEYYRSDVAAAALLMRRALAEYNLRPDLLIKSLIMDTVPVRAVLVSVDASGDHTPDPRRLAIGKRGGTMAEALAKIKQLEHAK